MIPGPTVLLACSVLLQQPRSASRMAAAVSWESLKTTLDDTVPVFVVTDEELRPTASETQVVCFSDAAAAQAELVRASADLPSLELRLQAVGLGTALERARLNRARIVPAAGDLETARAAFPDGEDWDGGALPLFGAYEMQRKRRDGTMATPLFMSVEDAKAALRAADPNRELNLNLVCTSLQRMTSLIVQGEVDAIEFVPATAAVELARRCAAMDDDAALPPGVTRGTISRSLPLWYGEDEGGDETQRNLFGLDVGP